MIFPLGPDACQPDDSGPFFAFARVGFIASDVTPERCITLVHYRKERLCPIGQVELTSAGSNVWRDPTGRARAARNGRPAATPRQPPELPLSHTIREKTKLLNRVRRIRGQIEAVERALDQEIGCADVLQLIAGARGAINGLMAEVIEDHVRAHLLDPAHGHDRTQAAEELIDVVRSYLK